MASFERTKALIPTLMLLFSAAATAQVGTGPEDAECGEGVADEYPDLYWTCEALQSFSKGFDSHALDLFKRASQWGNKTAQYRVGLMTLGGVGTEPDVIEGAAWLLLANERNNRRISARLSEVMGTLTEDQQREVKIRAAGLREEYGDFKALERRADWARWQKRGLTGSRTGRPTGSSLVMVSGDALAPGGQRPTGARNSGTIGVAARNMYDAYEIELRNIVTSVEYRDFDVLEDEVAPAEEPDEAPEE